MPGNADVKINGEQNIALKLATELSDYVLIACSSEILPVFYVEAISVYL